MEKEKNKNVECKVVRRFIFCVLIWLISFIIVVHFLTPEPAFFSYTDKDDLKCDTSEECLDEAQESAKKKWRNQHQFFEYTERLSQFVGFSILPLRYEIILDNRSYNQIETTGWAGEKRKLPAKVVCAKFSKPIEPWQSVVIENNLELKDIYPRMDALLNEFNGCFFDILQMNEAINGSLNTEKLIVSPEESVILSHQREFTFPVKLDGLSKLFVAVQCLLLLPVLLLIPKPVAKFIYRGRLFFVE